MMEFQKVSFSYEKKQVIQDLSFSLKNGEILKIGGGRYTAYTWNHEKE